MEPVPPTDTNDSTSAVETGPSSVETVPSAVDTGPSAVETGPFAVETVGFVPLDPRLLRLRSIAVAVVGVLLVIPAVLVGFLVDVVAGLVAVGFVAASTVLQIVAVRTSFRFWGYQIRDGDLTVRHGVLHRSVTSVSFNRVQHASLQSGPFERAMGLATISVFTAGGIGALRIEGLPNPVAAELQERILRRVAVTGRSTSAPPGPPTRS